MQPIHYIPDLPSFLRAAQRFAQKLTDVKRSHPLAEYGWYPYTSLSAVPFLGQLLEKDFNLLPPVVASEPALDIGCGDGDFAFFLESLGTTVDAIDYTEMNFNQMRGVYRLRDCLRSKVDVYSIDLDQYFELPRRRYGLALFLGTLYHLKNPFYVLDTLSQRAAYCILSTRVAQVTARDGVRVQGEPVAYLLDSREANDDSTNFWIFSEAGLRRLVERAGWSVRSQVNVGCLSDSNPVDSAADERIFLFLRSRVRYPDLHVRLLRGWHQLEEGNWRWTEKEFSFEVLLSRTAPPREFALAFVLPEMLFRPSAPVCVSCEVNGHPIGASNYSSPGSHTFRGNFRHVTTDRAAIRFRVEHDFRPPADDTRDLGVVISFADELAGAGSGLPFRVS